MKSEFVFRTLQSSQSSLTAYDALVFSAHPDDAEMVMGGTMIKLVNAGYRVLHICLSRGEKGTYGTPEARTVEFGGAAQIMGCDAVQCDLPDQGIENSLPNREAVARLIRTYKPRIIFSLYHTNPVGELGGVANVDHYSAGSLVRDAAKVARLAKIAPDLPTHTIQKLYFYMLPRTVQPTLYVDVSDVMDQTLSAIGAYQSQLNINFLGINICRHMEIMRAGLGAHLGVHYAEGFATEMPLLPKPGHFFEL